MESEMSTDKGDPPRSPVSLRKVFEYVACAEGIVAGITTGLAPQGSPLQLSCAILMGTAFGAAYLLKR
jgi:hypothetical protein